MNLHISIKYLKSSATSIATGVLLVLWLYFFKHDIFYTCFFAAWFIIIFLRGYFQYRKRESYLAELKKNGLTEEVVYNEIFIDKWTVKRKKGVYMYCLIEGFIVWGAYLTAVFCFIGLVLSTSVFSSGRPVDFSDMFWISCLLGIITGIAISIFLWSVNEKKFIRLTNPVH